MDTQKKEILEAQIAKLNEVIKTLKDNFDINEEIPDEYSFLCIVKEKLEDYIKA